MTDGFDASAFLNQTVDGPMSTSIPANPEGEYKMMISGDSDPTTWFGEAKWEKNGQSFSSPTCTIPVEILDDALRAKLGRDKVTDRIKMFLDMKDGRLDTSEGKNVKLGALRAALGQNEMAGWTFGKLVGAGPFIGRITQSSDKKDPTIKYSEVSRVSKLV
jgi:hypothetical protein